MHTKKYYMEFGFFIALALQLPLSLTYGVEGTHTGGGGNGLLNDSLITDSDSGSRASVTIPIASVYYGEIQLLSARATAYRCEMLNPVYPQRGRCVPVADLERGVPHAFAPGSYLLMAPGMRKSEVVEVQIGKRTVVHTGAVHIPQIEGAQIEWTIQADMTSPVEQWKFVRALFGKGLENAANRNDLLDLRNVLPGEKIGGSHAPVTVYACDPRASVCEDIYFPDNQNDHDVPLGCSVSYDEVNHRRPAIRSACQAYGSESPADLVNWVKFTAEGKIMPGLLYKEDFLNAERVSFFGRHSYERNSYVGPRPQSETNPDNVWETLVIAKSSGDHSGLITAQGSDTAIALFPGHYRITYKVTDINDQIRESGIQQFEIR